jgi:hypothetical protein
MTLDEWLDRAWWYYLARPIEERREIHTFKKFPPNVAPPKNIFATILGISYRNFNLLKNGKQELSIKVRERLLEVHKKIFPYSPLALEVAGHKHLLYFPENYIFHDSRFHDRVPKNPSPETLAYKLLPKRRPLLVKTLALPTVATAPLMVTPRDANERARWFHHRDVMAFHLQGDREPLPRSSTVIFRKDI